jgi:hypothetical protein
VEIIGVLKLQLYKLYNSKISCEMNGHYTIDEKESEDSDIEEILS